MRSNPLVSIVIPVYNAEKFIVEALQSIQAQNYSPVEVLLIDDGSTDATIPLAQEALPEIRIIRQPNAGAAAARNTGLKAATGDMICFLDADDGWLPGKLLAQTAYLNQHPEAGVVYHNWMLRHPNASGDYTPISIDSPSSSLEIAQEQSGWIYPKLLFDCIVHTSTVMMRREVLDTIGYFDTTLTTGEDYNYWLRISQKYQIHKLQGTYSYYRIVPGSLTNSKHIESKEYFVILNAIEEWGLTSPGGSAADEKAIRQRLARLALSFGYHKYQSKQYSDAQNAFKESFTYDPLNMRSVVYYLLAGIRNTICKMHQPSRLTK